MTVYIFFLSLLGFIWQGKESKIRFFFMMSLLFLFSICRSTSVGTDYIHYIESYNSDVYSFNIQQLDVFSFSDNSEFFNTDNRTSREFSWNILISFLKLFGNNPYLISHIIEALILLIISIGIKKLSPKPCMSIFLYVGLYLFFPVFNTIRQELAVSLFFLSAAYLVEKKYIKFIIIYAISATVHSSAIFVVFSFALLFLKKLPSFKVVSLIFIALIICQIENIKLNIISLIAPAAMDPDYYINNYSTGVVSNLANTFFILINFVFSLFFLYTYKLSKKDSFQFIIFWFIGLSILILLYYNKVLTRPIEYFMIFQIIIIPQVYKFLIGYSKIYAKRYYIITILYTIFVYICNLISNNQGIVPYKFI